MKQVDVEGMLFRGIDGDLYFVPTSALDQFRVFDHVRERIEPLLAGNPITQDTDLIDSEDEDLKTIPDNLLQAVHTSITIHVPEAEDETNLMMPLFALSYLEDKL